MRGFYIAPKRNGKGDYVMDLIMGMNSGSSFDGVDVVLAETEMAARRLSEAAQIPPRRLLRVAGRGQAHCD